jgi:2-dehydropantoate 2-reductase
MHIVIVGAGRVGSTFALHLARAGHMLTLVARGERLAQLLEDPAIETVAGERVVVRVARAIDLSKRWDLLLVAVRGQQIDELLPSLHLSAAKTILFMLPPSFARAQTRALGREPLERLRDAVGPARCEFGFTRVVASFNEGKLRSSVDKPGQATVLTSPDWQEHFAQAGIPSVLCEDMEGFLRGHAALCAPLLAMAQLVNARAAGVSWSEARSVARALAQGFALVGPLDPRLIPRALRTLSRVPLPLATALLWAASRRSGLRELDALGPGEVHQLFETLGEVAPDAHQELLAIRP